MKYFFTLVLLCILATGCKPKILEGKDLENKLKSTMKEYLEKTLQPGVQVTIKDVSYFPEKKKKLFICQFHVDMRYGATDTVGIVTGTISNDFSRVERTQ